MQLSGEKQNEVLIQMQNIEIILWKNQIYFANGKKGQMKTYLKTQLLLLQ